MKYFFYYYRTHGMVWAMKVQQPDGKKPDNAIKECCWEITKEEYLEAGYKTMKIKHPYQ